jgi:glycosyltransferase involved in cell wall biosynthesis
VIELRPPYVVPPGERIEAPLVVVLAENLSSLVGKGETVPNYYNIGNLFARAVLVLCNDDDPPAEAVQVLFGDCAVTRIDFPLPPRLFHLTAGYRPALLRPWGARLAARLRNLGPALVRAYGVAPASHVAVTAANALGIPSVVSLHGNPDVDYWRGRRAKTLKQKIIGRASLAMEVDLLRRCSTALPVYTPILDFLQKHGVGHSELVYNAVSAPLHPKSDYALRGGVVSLLCVGRQQSQEKDPLPIIEALRERPAWRLTLVGDGDLHQDLRDFAAAAGLSDRVTFLRNARNAEVLERMLACDIYVYQSHNYELAKGCIEAALCGLPVVLNDRSGRPAAELTGGHFKLVDGSVASYRAAIDSLAASEAQRRELGQRAFRHASEYWDPGRMAERTVGIYRALLGRSRAAAGALAPTA